MLGNARRTKCWLPYGLAGLLVLPLNVSAQAPASTPQAAPVTQPATVQSLKIIPLSGNQGMNDLERKIMVSLVVQVVDQSDQPVDGADVVFRFPLNGPGATFANQKIAQTFRTNADGQASATGWTSNGKVGTFRVQVTASRGNELGFATISMTNVTRIVGGARVREKHWWSSKGAKIGIAVGAAAVIAVAVILATRGSGSKSPTVITATPGSPTIGAPQ
jgi:hypothetical protein